jgi:DNA-binding CsgD family transcriptional regulator
MTREVSVVDGIYCIISHESELRRIHELSVSESLIGRSSACQIQLSGPDVSREHAVLQRTRDEIAIRDLGSRNGTFVGGRLIPKQEDVALSVGSEIQIGGHQLHICSRIQTAIEPQLNPEESTQSNSAGGQSRGSLIQELTPAQRRVLLGFANGFSEKEIARELRLSIHTIHTHSKAIYKLFGVSSRGELLTFWATHNMKSQ